MFHFPTDAALLGVKGFTIHNKLFEPESQLGVIAPRRRLLLGTLSDVSTTQAEVMIRVKLFVYRLFTVFISPVS